MKIAILTLPLHTNYGGILQAWALQTVLERMGHEVEVLSRGCELPMPKWYKLPLCYAKRIFCKLFKDWRTPIFYEQKYNKEEPVVRQHTQRFIDQYIHTRLIKSFDEIGGSEYDALVVGSDQVWRPLYFKGLWRTMIDNAFLGFAKDSNLKRCAYAASLGVDYWEYTEEETRTCSELINLFDAVSVRESSAVALLDKYFKVRAQHVLDPTLLLSPSDYKQLIKDEPKSEGNLLVYILDEVEEKLYLVEQIIKEKKLRPFKVINNAKKVDPVQQRIQPKVETWLKGFEDAEFVVTDSFHACVFAIIFGKPFVVVTNKGRGSARFDSLLTSFDMKEHLISEDNPFDCTKSYTISTTDLDVMKTESESFLARNLNEA